MNLQLAISLCTLLPLPQQASCLVNVHTCVADNDTRLQEEYAKRQRTFYADDKGCVHYSKQSTPVPVSSDVTGLVSSFSTVSSVEDCKFKPHQKIFIKEAMPQSWGDVLRSNEFAEDYEAHYRCWLEAIGWSPKGKWSETVQPHIRDGLSTVTCSAPEKGGMMRWSRKCDGKTQVSLDKINWIDVERP